MNETMRQFQQSLIELEAEAERLLLARNEVSFKILEVRKLGTILLVFPTCNILSLWHKLKWQCHNLSIIEMKLFCNLKSKKVK